MTRRVGSLAFALSIGLAASAGAGTLATPVVSAKDGEFLSCTVANAGAKLVGAVRTELILYDAGAGTVAASDGPVDLGPLASAGVAGAAISGVHSYQCRFTFKGSGKLLRANAVLIDGSFDVLDTQPAY